MVQPQTAAAGQRITVTREPKLVRIMRHEFSNGSGFDPAPLHKYLSTLSVEQVRLLWKTAHEYDGKHRLVVFVTHDPAGTAKPMCADLCDRPPTPVLSNARFAVFHCNGEGNKAIELVCYTEEFVLNRHYPKPVARTEGAPRCYKISAMNMTNVPEDEGDAIWHRVSTVNANGTGIAIHGGEPKQDRNTGLVYVPAPNALHGMINTIAAGCCFATTTGMRPNATSSCGCSCRIARAN